MNKIQKRRIYTVIFFLVGISIATTFILLALKKNINVFLTPNDLTTQSVPTDYHLRLGGLVKEKSIVRDKNSLKTTFVLTDYKSDIMVEYVGVLPDLFREGKGAVVEGTYQKPRFMATQVLAKHDENYMPKNVYEAIRKNNPKRE